MKHRSGHLRCLAMHWTNGSPVKSFEQMHDGTWFTTWHSAFEPQEPEQGSLHLRSIHAKWLPHSLLLIHSGLQFGGAPINSGLQEHDGELLTTWQTAFGPHGDGWHWLVGCTGSSAFQKTHKLNFRYLRNISKLNNYKRHLRLGKQRTKGSPVNIEGQLQIGLWLTTWHLADTPQDPGHGSLHLRFTQASFNGQSLLTIHSGRQAGGFPM